jgi:hypothetical protein
LIEERYLHQPFASIKVRQQWDTGYPLATISALEIDGRVAVHLAVSALFRFVHQKWNLR